MKKNRIRRLLSLMAVLPAVLLSAGTAPESLMASSFVLAPDSAVFMELEEEYGGSFGYFRVENVTPSAYVAVDSLKSSDPEVVTIEGVETMLGRDASESWCEVCLRLRGEGTADVAYRVGGVNCTTHVTVTKYKNPIRTITLTNVNGGADFSAYTDEAVHAPGSSTAGELALSESVKKPELALVTAEGWSIKSVSLENTGTGSMPSADTYTLGEGNTGVGSRIFSFSKLVKQADQSGTTLRIELVSPVTGQTARIFYTIH